MNLYCEKNLINDVKIFFGKVKFLLAYLLIFLLLFFTQFFFKHFNRLLAISCCPLGVHGPHIENPCNFCTVLSEVSENMQEGS